jgi:hypothetical protein
MRKDPPMPPLVFTALIAGVITAAALTVWLIAAGGTALLAVAVPAAMIATAALYRLRK